MAQVVECVIKEDTASFIPQSQCHDCSWPGDAGIRETKGHNKDIGIVLEFYGLASEWLTTQNVVISQAGF